MGGKARSDTAPHTGPRPWDWVYPRTAIRAWDWAYDCARPPSAWPTLAAHPQTTAVAKERSRPAAPHLPDEIWHRIAGHLSTKEWAGASGTCRQLRQLQLERLDVTAATVDGSVSALLWLAKQLPGATSIVLDGWPAESDLQQEATDDTCNAMQHALDVPQSLSKLTLLSVWLDHSADEEAEQVTSTGGQTHTSVYLAGILSKATRLSKLELVCYMTPRLPSLANLKHLALRLLRFPMDDGISTVLHNMPCLETLQISHPTACHDCMDEQVDARLVVPASVQRVELINVYPKSLLLDCDSTVVRLIGLLCCLQKALVNWDTVRRQLKGLRLYDRCDFCLDGDPMSYSDLWDRVEVLQFIRARCSVPI